MLVRERGREESLRRGISEVKSVRSWVEEVIRSMWFRLKLVLGNLVVGRIELNTRAGLVNISDPAGRVCPF